MGRTLLFLAAAAAACAGRAAAFTAQSAVAAVPVHAPPGAPALTITWVNGTDLTPGGNAYYTSGYPGASLFTRLPPAAQANVSAAAWAASRAPSGVFVQFASNASSLHLQYQLAAFGGPTPLTNLSSMPPTGFSGSDLYCWDATTSAWRWVATTFNGLSASQGNGGFVQEIPLFTYTDGWPVGPIPSQPTYGSGGLARYRLHLPSFAPISTLAVGAPSGAVLLPDADAGPELTAPAVAYYGGTAAQGAVTARPGSTLTARLARALGTQVWNFGFGFGGCSLEPGMAGWLAGTGAAAVVVDCGWDQDAAVLAANVLPFLQALFAAVPPAAPLPRVLLVEPTPFTTGWLLGDLYDIAGRRAALAAAFASFVAGNPALAGYVTYVNGSGLYGNEGTGAPLPLYVDPTYDGELPTDHGHRLVAAALARVLAPLLAGEPAPAMAGLTDGPVAMPQTAGPAVAPSPVSASASPASWTPATALTITGRAFNDTPAPFNRLPAGAQATVRSAVWGLALNSAGLGVSFTTNSASLWVQYATVSSMEPMVHFSATGVSGLDLYALDAASGELRFVATAPLPMDAKNVTLQLTAGNVLPAGTAVTYVAYMCTYNTAASLSIGIAAGATISAGPAVYGGGRPRSRSPAALAPARPAATGAAQAATLPPLVWYGTSILQGGVNCRPGNIFSSVVARAVGAPVFNFGFSGNGEMEINVAQWLVNITSPAGAVFIIDCDWNMNATSIAASAVPLVQYIRAHGHAADPVILAEGTPFGRNWAVPQCAADEGASNAALFAAYETLVAGGDANVHFVSGELLFGPAASLDSATANGLHPTDGGMADMAAFWAEYLPMVVPAYAAAAAAAAGAVDVQ